jgi:hypothetical protein
MSGRQFARCAIVGALTIIAVTGWCQTASGMGPHAIRWPGDHEHRFVDGQTATFNVDVSGVTVVGTPRFAWSVDADGAWCSAPLAADATTLTTVLRAGVHTIRNCAQDDDGTFPWVCAVDVTVWPAGPAPTFKLSVPKSATRKAFRSTGVKVTVTWNRPVRATFGVAYNRDESGTFVGNFAYKDRRVLPATTVQTGPRTAVVTVPAPPPSSNAGRLTRRLGLTANLAPDPIFGVLFSRPGHVPSDNPSGGVNLRKASKSRG